ncbi:MULTISPECIES: hypothetical protein [unclassified Burkholderia]|uniref:hypothetical protein n=1 Tax=unclassified Burkholderia TaxID=2613784 RepID=UPI000F59E1B6|nr:MULTISPECIES: hypothetical protein [unclassified Burkholderia]RQS53415.1 hypothetical protein DID99_19090 [Burkholderia sp. Bp8986]RQS56915.1 hypothetical protein DID98_21210 [Burkholderia sp. Bp8984]
MQIVAEKWPIDCQTVEWRHGGMAARRFQRRPTGKAADVLTGKSAPRSGSPCADHLAARADVPVRAKPTGP